MQVYSSRASKRDGGMLALVTAAAQKERQVSQHTLAYYPYAHSCILPLCTPLADT